MAAELVDIFPGESAAVFYTQGKQVNKVRTQTTGTLFTAYNNAKTYMRNHSLLKPSQRKQKKDNSSEPAKETVNIEGIKKRILK